jgi:hypothetical protein
MVFFSMIFVSTIKKGVGHTEIHQILRGREAAADE